MRINKFAVICAGLIFNLASLQQLIGIHPSYIILFFKRNIKVYEIFFITLIFFSLTSQAFINGGIVINYLQIIFDIVLAFMIYDIIISTNPKTIIKIINVFVNFLIIVAIVSTLDYYFLGNSINGILSSITLWDNTGEFLPRLSLTFSNPNWGSFTVFFFLVLAYIFKSPFPLKLKILMLIIFFQSKSAIIISALFMIMNANNGIIKSLIYAGLIVIVFFNFPNIISLEESASYINRLIMYQEVLDLTEIYPLGLMAENDLRLLISKTGEDTLPTILTLVYSLGWIIFLLFFLFIFSKAYQYRISLSIAIALLLFSLVYSFLTVSIVSAIGITLLLFTINKNIGQTNVKH